MNGMPQMGEAGCPMAKGYLTTVVRKLDILTGDVGITLTADQAADIGDCLSDVETPAKMSNGDAMTKYHRLANLLSADQKAHLAAIGLPQSGSDGPAMGPGMSGMMGGGAAPKQGENQAPFPQDPEAGEAQVPPRANRSQGCGPRQKRRKPRQPRQMRQRASRKVITLRYSGLLLRNNEPGLSFSA